MLARVLTRDNQTWNTSYPWLNKEEKVISSRPLRPATEITGDGGIS